MRNIHYSRHCEATKWPRQSRKPATLKNWIASSLTLLAMTGVITSLFLITACSDDDDHKKHKKNETDYIIYSPNGEPLNGGILGHPTCEAAMTRWFERVATRNDGILTKNAFLADAKSLFARMDIDHNGYLVSEELDRYRAPFRPNENFGKDLTASADDDQSEEARQKRAMHGGKGRKSENSDVISQGNLIDPVMSADTNLDFKVTLAEFLAQSQNHFNELDTDHNGKVSKDEVLKLCLKAK